LLTFKEDTLEGLRNADAGVPMRLAVSDIADEGGHQTLRPFYILSELHRLSSPLGAVKAHITESVPSELFRDGEAQTRGAHPQRWPTPNDGRFELRRGGCVTRNLGTSRHFLLVLLLTI